MIVDSTLNLSWPVIGAALKVHLRETPSLKLDDPSTYVFKVTNQLPSSSSTNPKAFSERYITVHLFLQSLIAGRTDCYSNSLPNHLRPRRIPIPRLRSIRFRLANRNNIHPTPQNTDINSEFTKR